MHIISHQMSAFLPYNAPAITSGAIQCAVPASSELLLLCSSIVLKATDFINLEIPKSPIFTFDFPSCSMLLPRKENNFTK